MSLITNYRSLLRKKVAHIKISGGDLQAIRDLRNKMAEPEEAINQRFSFGRLLDTLELLLKEEQADFKTDAPSQTDIERWALKYAVLEYYRGLGLPRETVVIDNPASGKTIHQYAPDTNKIYALWMNKLHDLTKKDDINHFAPQNYDTNFDRGTPQGGAFEKQLGRFREEFVERMIG